MTLFYKNTSAVIFNLHVNHVVGKIIFCCRRERNYRYGREEKEEKGRKIRNLLKQARVHE